MPTPETLDAARRAVVSIGIDTDAIAGDLEALWAEGYTTGTHAALAALPSGPDVVAPAFHDAIDWDNWVPGNAPAAATLADGAGGFATLLERSGTVTAGIADFTLERMARELAAGIDAGESTAMLAKRLDGALNDPKRALLIARTESARAQSVATLDTYALNGMGGKKWLASAGAEPHCAALNGKSWRLNDPTAPAIPAHPNCRCSWVPVLASEMPAPVGLLPRAKTLPHDRAGLSLEQYRAAKRELGSIKAATRRRAADVRDEVRDGMELADVAQMSPPGPRDKGSGLYDWFDALHPNEQIRLRRNWMKGDASVASPDQIAERLAKAQGGTADLDEQMARWLDATRRADAAGLLARGKLPRPSSYGSGGFDIDGTFGDGTYHVADLFDPDPISAIRSVAASTEAQADEFLLRIDKDLARRFKTSSPGRAPYEMTEDAYVDEITDLDARVAEIRPIRAATDDFGAEYSREDSALLQRFDELVPEGIPGIENMTGPEIHQAIMDLARKAGLA